LERFGQLLHDHLLLGHVARGRLARRRVTRRISRIDQSGARTPQAGNQHAMETRCTAAGCLRTDM